MPTTYPVELPDVNYFARQVLCREGCPVRTDSGGYVQAIAEGRYEDAYIIARTPNPFRLHLRPRLRRAVRGEMPARRARRLNFHPRAETVRLRKVRRRIGQLRSRPRLSRTARSAPRAHRRRAQSGGHRRRARRLVLRARTGVDGVCSDGLRGAQRRRAGCWCSGVPEYRLPREIIQAEIAAIESLGVEIRLNTRLGRDFALADLKQQGYEAVFLGIGAHKSRELAIEGVQLDGVLRAIEFLLNVNLGFRVTLGRKVVVIGGGNVAFDVARSVVRQAEKFAGMSEAELRVALHQAASALEELTAREPEAPDEVRLALDVAREAIRKGVPEVHMYCLENLDEIPAAREEIEEAEKEGIRLHTRFGPKRILGRDGKVTGIELIKASRVFDENRRFNPQFIEGSEETVDCDTVVLAIGQSADLSWIQPEDNLKLTPRGTLQTDPETMATSRPDVFAGGDVAFGPRIIITAVAEGKRAANSIAKFLTGRVPAEPRQARVTIYNTHQYRMKPDYEKLVRQCAADAAAGPAHRHRRSGKRLSRNPRRGSRRIAA